MSTMLTPETIHLGLQPEKNKFVFFGKKKTVFFAKKTQLEKNRSKFCFFHFQTFIHILMLPKLQKMANCAYIMPRTWITRHFNSGKKNLFM